MGNNIGRLLAFAAVFGGMGFIAVKGNRRRMMLDVLCEEEAEVRYQAEDTQEQGEPTESVFEETVNSSVEQADEDHVIADGNAELDETNSAQEEAEDHGHDAADDDGGIEPEPETTVIENLGEVDNTLTLPVIPEEDVVEAGEDVAEHQETVAEIEAELDELREKAAQEKATYKSNYVGGKSCVAQKAHDKWIWLNSKIIRTERKLQELTRNL
jgi:hypothetical protein